MGAEEKKKTFDQTYNDITSLVVYTLVFKTPNQYVFISIHKSWNIVKSWNIT